MNTPESRAAEFIAGRAIPQPHLTPRQESIVELVRQGLTNREIADRLNINIGTVKVHLVRIFKTLGTKNRTQVGLWAERRKTA